MNKVIAISCGLTEAKKEYTSINKRNLYLNYGLLGLCTILNEKGYDIKQFQGEYLSPEEIIQYINNTEYALNFIETPVLVSIVSFLSIEWCKKLTKILKQEYGKKIVLGGKYVIDGNVEWLRKKLPYVDMFLEGAGENRIEGVISSFADCKKEANGYYTHLNYSIVQDFKKYNPSIELARGCGRGCSFCADGTRRVSKLKNAYSVANEIEDLDRIYESSDYNIYFQMATFKPTLEWCQDMDRILYRSGTIHQWRCTSRIDTITPNDIRRLSNLGMKVIDLGLESASCKQLISMGKTSNPERYLYMADKLLDAASEVDVWVKLNVLLSAGETYDSVAETIEWLKKRKSYIKGVSVNCETVYGPNNNLMNTLKRLGASYVDETDLISKGYASINLSPEINYESSLKIALDISRSMMSADDYFDLKKYGYFSRVYTRDDFYKDLAGIDKEKTPFTI